MNASIALPRAATPPSPADIQLMQLTTACWVSRCVHVVAELGVADALGDQPQSTEAIAKATGTDPQALYRVLRLLASVGIFEWKHGTWHHTDASRFLRLPVFWSAFEDLEHSLRHGRMCVCEAPP